MVRVCRKRGRLVLIDRVASDDPACACLADAGLTVWRRQLLIQPMSFHEWMAAAGALDRAAQAKGLLIGANGEDFTGLCPREENGGLVVHHRTIILVAEVER